GRARRGAPARRGRRERARGASESEAYGRNGRICNAADGGAANRTADGSAGATARNGYRQASDRSAVATAFGNESVRTSVWLNGVESVRPRFRPRRNACTRSNSPPAT